MTLRAGVRSDARHPLFSAPDRRMVAVLASCLLVPGALAGCADLEFSGRGLYEAPNSGFRVLVVGAGTIPAGADISDFPTGIAWFCPAGASRGRPVRLTFAESEPVAADVREALDAVVGMLHGPKAGLLEGQTDALAVIEAEAHYDGRFHESLDTFECPTAGDEN